MARIRNVVFDMGQVLLRFDGMLFSRAFTSSEEDARALDDALFSNPSWALLDAGVISEDTMFAIARRRLPERLWPSLEDAAANWDLHQPAIDQTNDLARRLHQAGYDLYLLSNAGVRFDRAKGRIPVLPLLSGWVVSAYEHLMKPDPAIYALLCQRYGLEPSACLFVDDNQDNVEGARRAGMSAYRFTTAADLEAHLGDFGISL